VPGARFSALDSMNLWIETARDSLLAAIAEVDCLVSSTTPRSAS
jgi:hypothetical protein